MAIVSPIISVDKLAERIYWVRDRRVMLDADLAELYGVPTKRFNEQVKRNLGRFPADFMFQLTESEYSALRSPIATSKPERGGRRYTPYAFSQPDRCNPATDDAPRPKETAHRVHREPRRGKVVIPAIFPFPAA
jgi:hypothetical protein